MISLDSAAFYTAAELGKLDIDPNRLEQARGAGLIDAVRPGQDYLYRGNAILQWVEQGARTESRYRTGLRRVGSVVVIKGGLPTHAGASTGSVHGSSSASTKTTGGAVPSHSRSANMDPIERFDTIVGDKMAGGITKAAAVRATVVENKMLHAEYLEACTNLPHAQVGRRERPHAITHFNALVAEHMKRGLGKPAAVRATVVENQTLHAEYLDAQRLKRV